MNTGENLGALFGKYYYQNIAKIIKMAHQHMTSVNALKQVSLAHDNLHVTLIQTKKIIAYKINYKSNTERQLQRLLAGLQFIFAKRARKDHS